jgi:hypothetical protein
MSESSLVPLRGEAVAASQATALGDKLFYATAFRSYFILLNYFARPII